MNTTVLLNWFALKIIRFVEQCWHFTSFTLLVALCIIFSLAFGTWFALIRLDSRVLLLSPQNQTPIHSNLQSWKELRIEKKQMLRIRRLFISPFDDVRVSTSKIFKWGQFKNLLIQICALNIVALRRKKRTKVYIIYLNLYLTWNPLHYISRERFVAELIFLLSFNGSIKIRKKKKTW